MHAALPPSAKPTGTCCQPLHRRIIDSSPDDVIELTRQRVHDELGDGPHLVLTLRQDDLDPEQDRELYGLAERTDGGALVFGVSYVEEPER